MITGLPLQQTAPEHSPRVRVQASDTRFFAAFADSYRACVEVPPTPLTDDTIYAAYHRIYRDFTASPRWRAGRVAGWFAALYHIPCTFAETPPSALLPAHAPRAIDLQVTEPRCSSLAIVKAISTPAAPSKSSLLPMMPSSWCWTARTSSMFTGARA